MAGLETKRDLEDWSNRDVLHWLVSQDMGPLLSEVHKMNWSGLELLEVGTKCLSVDGTPSYEAGSKIPKILNSMNADETTKMTLLRRITRLVAHLNSEDTAQLHGWDFEKDWYENLIAVPALIVESPFLLIFLFSARRHEWRTILEEWQYSEIVNVKRRQLQRQDHQYSVAVLLVSTVATTWTAATYGRDQESGSYPAITLLLSCVLTILTSYLKLSGLKVQLEAAYATHEHQNHVTEFMLKQLSMRPEARHHHQEYKIELHMLMENRNEHASVLEITTSEQLKIVKYIRSHEDEIYRQLWAPYPGVHQKTPRNFSDPLKDAHDHDVNKGAYFEWHSDPDHDNNGYYDESLAALNHLSGGLLLRYWPLHRPETSADKLMMQKRSTMASFALGRSQRLSRVGEDNLPRPSSSASADGREKVEPVDTSESSSSTKSHRTETKGPTTREGLDQAEGSRF